MGKRIENADCCCGDLCPICTKPMNTISVTFSGVKNVDCTDCPARFNGVRLTLNRLDYAPFCNWNEMFYVSGCLGSVVVGVTIQKMGSDLLVTVSADTGGEVVEWRKTLAGADRADCSNLGSIPYYAAAGTPTMCDFKEASVTIP